LSAVLSLSDVLRLPRGVRLRFDEVRSAHVLLAPERAFDLDAVAAEVLGLVDGSRSVAAIIDVLAAKFEEDRSVIEGDVLAMLAELVKKRVIER
jgi:pyrroloquinoline quinone biosynthesis protein D